jgi:hypothetical protein
MQGLSGEGGHVRTNAITNQERWAISNHRAIPGPCSQKPARRPVMVQSVTSKLGAGGWSYRHARIDDAPATRAHRCPLLVLTKDVYVCAPSTETLSPGGSRIPHFANGPLAQVRWCSLCTTLVMHPPHTCVGNIVAPGLSDRRPVSRERMRPEIGRGRPNRKIRHMGYIEAQ